MAMNEISVIFISLSDVDWQMIQLECFHTSLLFNVAMNENNALTVYRNKQTTGEECYLRNEHPAQTQEGTK